MGSLARQQKDHQPQPSPRQKDQVPIFYKGTMEEAPAQLSLLGLQKARLSPALCPQNMASQDPLKRGCQRERGLLPSKEETNTNHRLISHANHPETQHN